MVTINIKGRHLIKPPHSFLSPGMAMLSTMVQTKQLLDRWRKLGISSDPPADIGDIRDVRDDDVGILKCVQKLNGLCL